jgi:hypothetical protein
VVKLTNEQRRERRREAARKAAETRRVQADIARGELALDRTETAEEGARRARAAEEKRLTNLRAVLAEARRIRRESDLYYRAHCERWSHHPSQWTAEQIDTAGRFLQGFIRPDGTPDPHPVRRKGRWRA